MKNNNEIVVIGLMFLLATLAGQAGAATVIGSYEVSAAVVDPVVYAGGGGHALVFSGDQNDYVFSQTPGSLIEYDDGTASFEGQVYSDSAPNRGFSVSLQLLGRTTVAEGGSPKKELRDSAYIENGGSVDSANWYYYSSFSGTLTGTGDLDGLIIPIIQRGPAFQIGVGADNKNLAFGASAWFDGTDNNGHTVHGDFNVELTAVPVPAAIQLMLSAIGALGLAARRRRES